MDSTNEQPKSIRTASIISENWPNEHKPKSTRFDSLKKRNGAIWGALIHVPSVAISLGVLSLTFLQIFWEAPSERTNAVLNSLQFAAQLHTRYVGYSFTCFGFGVGEEHRDREWEQGCLSDSADFLR